MWSKFKGWHSGLSGVGKFVFATVVASSVVGLIAMAGSDGRQPQQSAESAVEVSEPKVEVQTINELEEIPFDRQMVDDPSLDKGVSQVTTIGVNGTKTLTYEVTLTDGAETDKKLISEEVTKQPIAEVTSIGTKLAAPAPVSTTTPPAQLDCNPNYSGCVPNASDVDCLGGTGNGPAYTGRVNVIGTDVYGLDGNKDGVACE